MSEPFPVYSATPPHTARIDHHMKARAVAIQFLRMLEDELVALGGLRPEDRACLTRAERRAAAREHEYNSQKESVNDGDERR